MRAFFCGLPARDRRGVGAEDVLEGAQALAAQLVAVADEQRAPAVGRRRRCA